MEQVTINDIKTNLNHIFNRVNQNHKVISVVRDKKQSVILIDADEYNSLMETLYLLQDSANAKRLDESIKQHSQGQYKEIDVKTYLD